MTLTHEDWMEFRKPLHKAYAAEMALITLREAGERLGLQAGTLRMAIRRGKMTGHKYGRDWLVEESEVAWYEMRSLGRVGWPKGKARKSA